MDVFSNGLISLDFLKLGSKTTEDFLALRMLGITYKEESWKVENGSLQGSPIERALLTEPQVSLVSRG